MKNETKRVKYGRENTAFHEYAKFIVEHDSYKGMPDVYKDDGGIQWEAPSNRPGGKFKDTHHRRREWWKCKAIELGISPEKDAWISKTAKTLHPTKSKPCKNCGRIMDIRYVYPNSKLLKRISKLEYFTSDFEVNELEHIDRLVIRLIKQFGARVFADLPNILKTDSIIIRAINPTIKDWLHFINNEYVPLEPKLLSPGAMSNAPDRLDGFHTFNRCCRQKVDKGRSVENLRSYSTDRRVFEYWVDGDWVAANTLVGLIRSNPDLQAQPCLNGHSGPCSADHIGPISLGFAHRPEFQFLCKSCNSGKNNRMFYSDVSHLREVEGNGENVTSWYSKTLWDSLKHLVVSEETALRLSKILRDNRHNAMFLIQKIAEAGHFCFLSIFLGLHYADFSVLFDELIVRNHKTKYKNIERHQKFTKYANIQKARRIRIAFHALEEYTEKENRNAFLISNRQLADKLNDTLNILEQKPEEVYLIDLEIANLLKIKEDIVSPKFQKIMGKLSLIGLLPKCFPIAKETMNDYMDIISKELSAMWEADRYVREIMLDTN
ncbi:Alw26I/Eco31I/Esp3I family type II restriction endonuclease [Gorillibacterium sp. sgz500922]|uniref:Alw26I/Eco31I/Esp3I family type II restriction endonuclease n=1 Tax=Gorillibacterium sp. sgz500922 TaxID=3446694 RepID=UPI003F6656AA